MRIGIFTDTYRPSLNGIVFVTEILRRNFEAAGHEVYIFAPAASLRGKSDTPDDHIIRFPAVSGIPYDDFNASLFFPPKVTKKINELNLDILHFLTPGPVGLMAMYAAHKLKKPIVAEYCTDLFEYVGHYPMSLPVIAALGGLVPFLFKISREEFMEGLKAARPRLSPTSWNREVLKQALTAIYGHCNAVIVHSQRSISQLVSWQDEDTSYSLELIPTGVDRLPAATADDLAAFKKQWGVADDDEVVLFVGRLSAEKNLDMLIAMIAELIKWHPKAKLMFVGDFAEYRPKLEAKAQTSAAAEHIIFTGKIPREHIAVAFDVAKVFVFPSLTDTQGLVLHEAALEGLPIVMIDSSVTEVVQNGRNGYFCKDDPIDMAARVRDILDDPELYEEMRAASRALAAEFSERGQCDKILAIYERILASQPTA